MASCVKCGAALISQARFCATCGSPVTRSSLPPAAGSAPPPAPPPKSVVASVPDPFARTILRGDVVPSLDPAPAPAVSPMAASLMSNQTPPPPAPSPASPAAAAYAAMPNPSPPAGPTQYAQPVAQQTHSIAPGTLVLVYWANGQRYPGTVLQVSAHHLFVAFPNGMQQWVDARYVVVGA